MASLQPISTLTYTSMVTAWLKFAQFHEIGYFVWAPGSAPDRRILQFLNDDVLQKKLIPKRGKKLLIYLDFQQAHSISPDDLHNKLFDALRKVFTGSMETKNISEIVHSLENQGYDLYLFILGIDNLLKDHIYSPIKELYLLYEQVRNMSLLFFTTTYLDDQTRKEILQKNASSANIFYKPLYTEEDTAQFITFLEDYWKIHVPPEHVRWVLDECGGKLGLIKTAIRIIRDNPNIATEELEAHSSLQERAKYILSNLNHDARAILQRVSKTHTPIANENADIVNYLIHIGFLSRIDKAYAIRPKYLTHFLFSQDEESFSSDLPVKEYAVLQCLSNKKNTIVSRDQIAQSLWGTDWEDKYSDWAIDQAIHRLRSKLRDSASPYSIHTKKGVGFMLRKG